MYSRYPVATGGGGRTALQVHHGVVKELGNTARCLRHLVQYVQAVVAGGRLFRHGMLVQGTLMSSDSLWLISLALVSGSSVIGSAGCTCTAAEAGLASN